MDDDRAGNGQPTSRRLGSALGAAGLALLGLGLASACASGDEGEGGSGAATTTTSGTGATGGSASGGGGQTTTSSSTSSTSSSGGSGPGETECLNEQDDDEDSFVDCADTDCQDLGYECVPAFSDEVQYVGVFANAPCPTGTNQIQLRSCDGCVCNVDPGSCNVSVELCDSGCSNCIEPLTNAGCRDVTDEARSIRGTFTPRNDDSCTVADGSVPSNDIVVCALPWPGSCPSGSHCVPPAFASATRRCVLLEGDGDCPGAYSDKRVVFPEAADFCACDCTWGEQSCDPAPAVVSHDTNNCSGTVANILLDGVCRDGGAVHSVEIPTIDATVQCDRTAVPVGTSITTRSLCCLP